MTNQSKIKIVFILPSLVAGGAERVVSFISQNINKGVFDPVLLIAGRSEETVYDVSNVEVIYLNKSRLLNALPLILKYLKAHKPHIVFSSISHTNKAMSIIAPLFKKTKFIGREATILSKRKNEKKARKYSPITLLPKGFKNLDMLVCQSEDMAKDMKDNFFLTEDTIRVINNPISNLPPLKSYQNDTNKRKFITVGRLVEVKGHIRILEILSKLNEPFSYTIIGSGPLKDQIFDKAAELSIDSCINYIPYSNTINDYLTQHDLFLQGSFVEGFPNALLESCVAGIPVIAFDVPGGTKEIVEQGINGYLVNNEDEFLERLKEQKNWNPETIRESVYKKFNQEKIISEYEQLFLDILK